MFSHNCCVDQLNLQRCVLAMEAFFGSELLSVYHHAHLSWQSTVILLQKKLAKRSYPATKNVGNNTCSVTISVAGDLFLMAFLS